VHSQIPLTRGINNPFC